MGSDGPILSLFSETLNGLATMRAYNIEKTIFNEYASKRDLETKNQILPNAIEAYTDYTVQKIGSLMFIPSIMIPLLTVPAEDMTPGFIGVLFTLCFQNIDKIWALLESTHCFEDALADLERCLQLKNIKPEESDAVAASKKKNEDFVVTDGQIEFDNLWAKYRPELPHVLKGLSCTIKSQEKIGIVGRTGAGKSTFFTTLLKILKLEKGTIRIDG